MTGDNSITLELDDIQAGVLRGRPTPYAGAFLLLRIDDPRDGRTLAGRLADVVHEVHHPETDTSFSVGFTYAGLRALGVPQESLETFAPSCSATWGPTLPSTGRPPWARTTSTWQ